MRVRSCVCGCGCRGAGVCLNAFSLTNPAWNTPSYCHLPPLWLHQIAVNTETSSCKEPLFLSHSKKKNLGFSLTEFRKKCQIPNFIKIRLAGAELFHASGWTDMTRLIIVFRNIAKGPKNWNYFSLYLCVYSDILCFQMQRISNGQWHAVHNYSHTRRELIRTLAWSHK